MLRKTMEAVNEGELPDFPANRCDVLRHDPTTVVKQGHVWFITVFLDVEPDLLQFRDQRSLQHHYPGDAVPTKQNERLAAKAPRAIECNAKRPNRNGRSGDASPLDNLLPDLGSPAYAQQTDVEQLRPAGDAGQSVPGAQAAGRPFNVQGVVGLWFDREENRAYRRRFGVQD
jgi:hypothetical protein